MSSTQEGTTLILASVAVCLLIYVMKLEFDGPRAYPRVAGLVGAVKSAVGASSETDCSTINPGHADWAKCAQGSAMGRVPTKDPSSVLRNTTLDFVSDSINSQGLGVGRLQDDFVNEQYANNSLGAPRPGGMRINKSNLKNNSFFSAGTQNATKLVTSGISDGGAEAFPFLRKSDGGREKSDSFTRANASGGVPGTEAVGMGMKISELKKPTVWSGGGVSDGDGRGISSFRSQVNKKLGVAPFEDEGAEFNPFAGTTTASLGAGLKISEAYKAPQLGMGSKIDEAYGSLGAAVSPFSSDVGVSPGEISAATASLSDINIVQSKPGGHIDRFIRP